MKRGYLLVFAGLFIVLIACKKNKSDFGDSSILIAPGKCISLDEHPPVFTICVDSLYDSRCPEGMICIWGGIAKGKFTVTVNNTLHSFHLSPKAWPSYPTDTVIMGYKIEFLDIEPHNGAQPPQPVSQARLRITKP